MTDAARPVSTTSDTYGFARSLFRGFVHWASYHFVLSSRQTKHVRIADLDLEVPPTVFHPGIFVTSRMFSNYLRCADFRGRTIAEVGTGSGVLALAAACAGASRVLALDVNPAAVDAAARNARANGLSAIVEARVSDLLAAVTSDERFDVIISSPPSFAGEPHDISDRAWHAGPGYRDLRHLFDQAYARLNANGEMLLLLSSDTDLALIKRWAMDAGFDWQLLAGKSIVVESFLIFRLAKGSPVGTTQFWLPSRAELQAACLRRIVARKVRKLEQLASARMRLQQLADAGHCWADVSLIDREMRALSPAVVCDTYLWQARERALGSEIAQLE
jgi:release factor glutamine methyltransferase